MSNTYILVKQLIKLKKTEGLAHKVDVFYAAGRLTDAEYSELIALLVG